MSLEHCLAVAEATRAFHESIDWDGRDRDFDVIIPEPDHLDHPNRTIVVRVHKVPRFKSCQVDELSDVAKWGSCKMEQRITQMVYGHGDLVCRVEKPGEDGKSLPQWTFEAPWAGRSTFVFITEPVEPSPHKPRAKPSKKAPPPPPPSRDQRCEVVADSSGYAIGACVVEPGGRMETGEKDEDSMQIKAKYNSGSSSGDALKCVVCNVRGPLLPCLLWLQAICGRACLLRHSEGRYERHESNEQSETFERVKGLSEKAPDQRKLLPPARPSPEPSPEGNFSPPLCPNEELLLICPWDSLGAARRALELLDITPAAYISIVEDAERARVIERNWPDVTCYKDIGLFDPPAVKELMKDFKKKHPRLRAGLIVGGPDRHPPERFRGVPNGRVMWLFGIPDIDGRPYTDSAQFFEEAKEGVDVFAKLVRSFKDADPSICWHAMLDDGAPMSSPRRKQMTELLTQAYRSTPVAFDASDVGPVRCPRLFWPSFPLYKEEMLLRGLAVVPKGKDGLTVVVHSGLVTSLHDGRPIRAKLEFDQLLEGGCQKNCGIFNRPFTNMTRRRQLARSPSESRMSRKDCDKLVLRRWEMSNWPLAPVHFEPENCVIDGTRLRPPNARESERMRGFNAGHTEGRQGLGAASTDGFRLGLIGTSVSCIVLAQLLASWAMMMGAIPRFPTVTETWRRAGIICDELREFTLIPSDYAGTSGSGGILPGVDAARDGAWILDRDLDPEGEVCAFLGEDDMIWETVGWRMTDWE